VAAKCFKILLIRVELIKKTAFRLGGARFRFRTCDFRNTNRCSRTSEFVFVTLLLSGRSLIIGYSKILIASDFIAVVLENNSIFAQKRCPSESNRNKVRTGT
jgi:hypothetical protein